MTALNHRVALSSVPVQSVALKDGTAGQRKKKLSDLSKSSRRSVIKFVGEGVNHAVTGSSDTGRPGQRVHSPEEWGRSLLMPTPEQAKTHTHTQKQTKQKCWKVHVRQNARKTCLKPPVFYVFLSHCFAPISTAFRPSRPASKPASKLALMRLFSRHWSSRLASRPAFSCGLKFSKAVSNYVKFSFAGTPGYFSWALPLSLFALLLC